VSPARARTSNVEILAAGRDLLEAGGLDAVTMQDVAARVGVRGPSLYKRFPSRDALISAIGEAIWVDLAERLEPVAGEPDAVAGLRGLAGAYRAFAHANPRGYELLFMNLPPEARPSAEHNARASAPLLGLTARLVGPARALEAARLVTAFAHGFVSMELNGAFRLGGDIEAAYEFGVEALIDALAARSAELETTD
jgi:AcrR family transcriptional regulator